MNSMINLALLALLALFHPTKSHDAGAVMEQLAQEAGRSICRFSVKLADILIKEKAESNVVYSPLSIALALAMLEGGAKGDTRLALLNALLGTDAPKDNSSSIGHFSPLQSLLKAATNENLTLQIANAIFVKKSKIKAKEGYLQELKQFDAEVNELPDDNEEGVEKVNNWISEKTNQKIPKLFTPGSFDDDTRFVLANAIYMNAQWKHRFTDVVDKKFYRNGKLEDVQFVPFAWRRGELEVWALNGYQAVALPYAGDQLEMIMIKLPKGNSSDVEQRMNGVFEVVKARNSSKWEYELSIPKFTFLLKTDLLQPVLEKLGLGNIFSNSADFTGISDVPTKVDKAVHEAFIKVDEKGTEAAAATAISSILRMAPPTLTFDHPFIFIIAHKTTRAHLFVGQVNYIENQDE